MFMNLLAEIQNTGSKNWEMKEEINKFTIRVGNFEMPSKIIDIRSKQKISTDIEAMNT